MNLRKLATGGALGKHGVALIVIALAIFGLQPFGIGSNYWSSVLVMGGIYALLAMGLNVVTGYAGLLTLGFAGFWGIGAYVAAFATGKAPLHPFSTSIWGAMALAVIGAVIAGLLLGFASLRVRGDYLAIVTLGFGEIVRIIANYWDPVTNGPTGITGIPHPTLFGFKFTLDPRPYVLLVFVLIGLLYFMISSLWHSKIGRGWYATKLDEDAAEAAGVPTFPMKLLAFAIGVSTAGFAGALYGSYIGYISPDNFVMLTSVMVMASIVVGGMSNAKGAIIGAFLVVGLPEMFRGFAQYRYLAFGAVLVAMMILRPEGLLPMRPRRYRLPKASGKLDLPHLTTAKPLATGTPILECVGVTKRFGGLTAVDNASFDISEGIVFALIGPNGAGKTTLFNLITGALTPTSGVVKFRDEFIQTLKPHQRTRRGIARTFQQIRLFGDATVAENVLTGADSRATASAVEVVLRGVRHRREEAEEMRRVAEILSFCGIASLADERAGDLSYGDQRRVEIARALATEPTLLLLDEPAAGMNPTEKRELMQLIARIKEQGITVLIIEHDMNLVMEISDQVMVLDHGVVIARGQPADIQANPKVVEAYLGADIDALTE